MRHWIFAAAASGALIAASAAVAADPVTTALDLRLGKLEKEMKAVQRTVFPGGTPVQPEIGGATGPATPTGSPAGTNVSDLTARVDALEKSMASITGQVEQASYRSRQNDDTIKRLEARLARLEGSSADSGDTASTGSGSAMSGTGSSSAMTSTPSKPATAPAKPAATTTTTTPAKPATPAKSDASRRAAVAAVEMPDTGDAAEDAYSYGYRLYAAKLYPEAEAKLKEFVAKYPTHRRASYAQNLLGRAYYDEGKPALASVAFYDNYQKMPKGDRASESLYWLGQSLTKLRKLPDACKVYNELFDVYGSKMSADLKAKATKGRADAKCSS